MDAGLLETETTTADAPNVIWTGEGDPPSAVNVGNIFIGDLPDAAAQRAGFRVSSEHAALLCAVMNGYKAFVGKGGA